MNSFFRSSAALGISAVLCTGGCSGAYVTTQIFTDETTEAPSTRVWQPSRVAAYPNYSCSATNCSLGAVASSPAYPPMMLAVAKTTTIISLSDDPMTDGVALGPIAEQ